jgi:hypothetical protein
MIQYGEEMHAVSGRLVKKLKEIDYKIGNNKKTNALLAEYFNDINRNFGPVFHDTMIEKFTGEEQIKAVDIFISINKNKNNKDIKYADIIIIKKPKEKKKSKIKK